MLNTPTYVCIVLLMGVFMPEILERRQLTTRCGHCDSLIGYSPSDVIRGNDIPYLDGPNRKYANLRYKKSYYILCPDCGEKISV